MNLKWKLTANIITLALSASGFTTEMHAESSSVTVGEALSDIRPTQKMKKNMSKKLSNMTRKELLLASWLNNKWIANCPNFNGTNTRFGRVHFDVERGFVTDYSSGFTTMKINKPVKFVYNPGGKQKLGSVKMKVRNTTIKNYKVENGYTRRIVALRVGARSKSMTTFYPTLGVVLYSYHGYSDWGYAVESMMVRAKCKFKKIDN